MRDGTDNTDDPSLLRDLLASPGEVTRFQSQGTVLQVSTPDPDTVDALGSQFCVGWLTAKLELSLLAIMGTLCARS